MCYLIVFDMYGNGDVFMLVLWIVCCKCFDVIFVLGDFVGYGVLFD